jgi:hypothetical protein
MSFTLCKYQLKVDLEPKYKIWSLKLVREIARNTMELIGRENKLLNRNKKSQQVRKRIVK